jgi:hypothetical protein
MWPAQDSGVYGCRDVTVPPVYRCGRITPEMPLTNDSVPVTRAARSC